MNSLKLFREKKNIYISSLEQGVADGIEEFVTNKGIYSSDSLWKTSSQLFPKSIFWMLQIIQIF